MIYEGKVYDHEKIHAFWFLILVIIFLINCALAAITSVDDYYTIGRGELVFMPKIFLVIIQSLSIENLHSNLQLQNRSILF